MGNFFRCSILLKAKPLNSHRSSETVTQLSHEPSQPLAHHIGFVATSCGLVAATGYMLANIFLRSVTHLDPTWVTCAKALPTVLVCTPLMLRRIFNRQSLFFSTPDVWRTLLVAIIGQLAGNVCFQWSLSVVGLALSVPLTLGAMIASGALMGHWILKDRVTFRMAMASLILVIAICILSLGAMTANQAVSASDQHSPLSHAWVIAGVGAACMAGIAYSLLNVSIRFSSNRGTPQLSILFTVGLVGVVLLGSIVYGREGRLPIAEMNRQEWIALLGAGSCNLVAFWALTRALQIASVMFVNALNASQTAMAAMAGVLLFGEPLTLAMVTGCVLTILGLLQMRERPLRPKAATNHSDKTISN